MTDVVDTHAVIWYLEGSPRLSQTARSILNDPRAVLVIPSIVLAELRYLTASGRVSLPWETLVEKVTSDARFVFADLDVRTVLAVSIELEMHDAIICATAGLFSGDSDEEVRVITNDRAIRDSGLVTTVW